MTRWPGSSADPNRCTTGTATRHDCGVRTSTASPASVAAELTAAGVAPGSPGTGSTAATSRGEPAHGVEQRAERLVA